MDQGEESLTTNAPFIFLKEIVYGVIIFLAIAAAAVGLSFLVKLLISWDVEPILIYGLKTLEYLIFAADFILMVRFIVLTTIRTWKRL